MATTWNRREDPLGGSFWRSAAIVVVLLALTPPLPGCRLGESHVRDRSPRGCAECHEVITRQWASSGHAASWNDAQFRVRTNQRTVKGCLPCHAPSPLLEQDCSTRPELRGESRGCGIDCNSCHAVGRAYAGPYDSWGPHPVKQYPARHLSAALCGRCHESEQNEYTKLYLPLLETCATPKECADCHMPACVARLTEGHILSLVHPRRLVRDHSFAVWNDKVAGGAVEVGEITLVRGANNEFIVTVTLTNRGAAHRIPTGGYGYREVRILVELIDAAGAVVGQSERSLIARKSNGLAPFKPTSFHLATTISPGAQPMRLRLRVERVNQDRSFRYLLASRERPIADVLAD